MCQNWPQSLAHRFCYHFCVFQPCNSGQGVLGVTTKNPWPVPPPGDLPPKRPGPVVPVPSTVPAEWAKGRRSPADRPAKGPAKRAAKGSFWIPSEKPARRPRPGEQMVWNVAWGVFFELWLFFLSAAVVAGLCFPGLAARVVHDLGRPAPPGVSYLRVVTPLW